MIVLDPFEWKMMISDVPASPWLKELQETETSKMTKDEFKELAPNFGYEDVSEVIDFIEEQREEYKKDLLELYGKEIDKFLEGVSLEQFVRNAYPYEIFLSTRY